MNSRESRFFARAADILGFLCSLLALSFWSVAWDVVSAFVRLAPLAIGGYFLSRALLGTRVASLTLVILGVAVSLVHVAVWPGTIHWLLLFVFGLLSWLYGVWAGTRAYDTPALHRQLLLGATSAAISMVIAGTSGVHLLVPLFALWAVTIVLTIVLAYLAQLSAGSSFSIAANRFWGPLVVGTSVFLLLLAFALSLVTPGLAGLMKGPVALLGTIARLILLGMGYLAALLVQLLLTLISKITKQKMPERIVEPFSPGEIFDQQATREISPLVLQGVVWFGALAAIALAALLIYYLVSRWQSRPEANEAELERESYASIDALKKWGRLRFLDANRSLGSRLPHLRRRQEPHTATQIYNALLRLAEKNGVVREPGVTPCQFQPSLSASFAGHGGDADLLLKLFISEYYGGEILSADDLTIAGQVFRRMTFGGQA